ncbi:MAG: SURF1 family protein [Gallionella sp.]
MQFHHYRFRPKLIPTLVTLATLPILVSFGLWQSNKADQKQALQDTYDARASQSAVRITSGHLSPEEFRYKKVVVRGQFDTANQILLDNQVYNEAAGYHVITPFQIESSRVYILVNRGWVPLGADRAVLPKISTPEGMLEIGGIATLPPSKIYELMQPESLNGGWQTIWQNMDLERYREAVPFQLQPVIIQMDKDSQGGFVREWPRPDTRIQTHLGYAFQWFGMAVILVLFYVVTNFKKITETETDKND